MAGDYCEDYSNDGMPVSGVDDEEEFSPYYYWREDEFYERERMDDRYCLFPDECCMPGPHTSDECHTAEMIEQMEREEYAK